MDDIVHLSEQHLVSGQIADFAWRAQIVRFQGGGFVIDFVEVTSPKGNLPRYFDHVASYSTIQEAGGAAKRIAQHLVGSSAA